MGAIRTTHTGSLPRPDDLGVRGLGGVLPQLVLARVAVCNVPSRGLLKRHAITLQLAKTDPGYLDLVGRTDEVLATLPPSL
jgi:hypothetical protein